MSSSAAGSPTQQALIDMRTTELFHHDEGCPNFEDLGRDNGFRYWFALDLGICLGYENYETFKKAVNKAIAACANLNIPVDENFVQVRREVDGREVSDYKLSRFACYLTAMNGDTKKPKVAQAQMYFAVMAESFRQYIEDADDIERLSVRDEITGREKALGATAKNAGVTEYALFQNAGYRGLYNMNLRELRARKGLSDPRRSLLDFMGKQELAANLFRLTETQAKIQNEKIKGQKPCENAAETVGRMVRQTMQKISGTAPETLPLEGDLKETRKNLKQAHRGFKRIDDPKKKSKKKKA